MKTLVIIFIVVATATLTFGQKNYIDVRGATPYYQYEEYGRELPDNFTLDFVHIGASGQHQFFAGIGKRFTPAKGVTLTPYVYAVVGSNNQRGAMVALSVSAEKGKWKANAFVGKYIPLKGDVKTYAVLDTGDVTRTINKRVDAGLSTGFFRQEGQWNLQVGPMIRLKDKLGAWAVSYRFGKTNELRVTRVFSF